MALWPPTLQALIYLTHLDPEHMENLVLQRVAHECLERKDTLERWCPTMLLGGIRNACLFLGWLGAR